MLVAVLVAAFVALRTMGAVEMRVTEYGATLAVRRTLFFVPGPWRTFSLGGVSGVVVEHTTFSRFLQQRYAAPVASARLRLEYANGEQKALTRRSFPGDALHLRAASALRAALLVDANDADDAKLAAIPMRTTPMAQRAMYAWMGITTGSVVGIGLFGVSLIALHVTTFRANIEGWMVAGGTIPGAIAGVAFALHATRPRLPR